MPDEELEISPEPAEVVKEVITDTDAEVIACSSTEPLPGEDPQVDLYQDTVVEEGGLGLYKETILEEGAAVDLYRGTVVMKDEETDDEKPSPDDEVEKAEEETTAVEKDSNLTKIPRWGWIGGGVALLAVVEGFGALLIFRPELFSAKTSSPSLETPLSSTIETQTDGVVLELEVDSVSEEAQVEVFINLIDGAEVVFIPAGIYTIGSEDGEDDEKPVHDVVLDEFYMYKYEVSAAQYLDFLDQFEVNEILDEGWMWARGNAYYDYYPTIKDFNGGFQLFDPDINLPATGISWEGANQYCSWVGGRLPTQAEYKVAAHGGRGTISIPGEMNTQPVTGRFSIPVVRHPHNTLTKLATGLMEQAPLGSRIWSVMCLNLSMIGMMLDLFDLTRNQSSWAR